MISSTLPLTRGYTSQSALTDDQLRRNAPSVFAAVPMPGVSARYSFAPTITIVNVLRAEGWEPTKAAEQDVRLDARRGFQKHELRFARKADLDVGRFEVGGSRPEIILSNAHDTSSAYRLRAGLWRKVCANGLFVDDSTFASVAIRHSRVHPEVFVDASRHVAGGLDKIMATVERWQAVTLTGDQRAAFARSAASLRWDEDSAVFRNLDASHLLAVRRAGDDYPSLWNTYNVVQENLMKGGIRYYGGEYEARCLCSRRRTREVSGIGQGHRLNVKLWKLAESLAN